MQRSCACQQLQPTCSHRKKYILFAKPDPNTLSPIGSLFNLSVWKRYSLVSRAWLFCSRRPSQATTGVMLGWICCSSGEQCHLSMLITVVYPHLNSVSPARKGRSLRTGPMTRTPARRGCSDCHQVCWTPNITGYQCTRSDSRREEWMPACGSPETSRPECTKDSPSCPPYFHTGTWSSSSYTFVQRGL